MLKSTYRPPALAPGWTEHKAPTGHTYYHNASTGESTYRRPATLASTDPFAGSAQHRQAAPALNLSNPAAANAFMVQHGNGGGSGGFGRGGTADARPGGREYQRGGGSAGRPRPQPVDKPRSAAAIPGCEPWVLVYTKYGRRFAHNPTKGASYWRVPDKLKPGILQLDQQRIRHKAGASGPGLPPEDPEAAATSGPTDAAVAGLRSVEEAAATLEAAEKKGGMDEESRDYDSSEYEEVEVTDDEGGDEDEDEDEDEEGKARRKRQRTEEPDQWDEQAAAAAVEFTEEDIAAQLQAMGEEYAAEAAEEEGEGEDRRGSADAAWDEGERDLELSEEDARALFRDLLDDLGVNPYSPWEKLLEEGRAFDDARYGVLGSTRARREVWEEWSRDRIRQLRERRAREDKPDPRAAYLALLQERATTPKLYWAEFRRKHRKEPAMRDAALSDRDREKWYREHVARLRLPQATLKADLKALLESAPPAELNSHSDPARLPARILADVRFVSLDPKVRDPIVEAYIQSLGPPPERGGGEEEDASATKAREERRKRQQALEERERAVAEEKRRQELRLRRGRADLREEERELERAMRVGKKGLQSQLAGAQDG